MNNAQSVIIIGDQARRKALDLVRAAPVGYVVVVSPAPRTERQNAAAWALCADIAEQVQLQGRRFPREVWWLMVKRDVFGPDLVTLPDGELVEREPRSRWRDREEFARFLGRLEEIAIEHDVVRKAAA